MCKTKVKEFVLSKDIGFVNDPMMRELHKIGLKMYHKTKNMSDEQWVRYIQKMAKKLRLSYTQKG